MLPKQQFDERRQPWGHNQAFNARRPSLWWPIIAWQCGLRGPIRLKEWAHRNTRTEAKCNSRDASLGASIAGGICRIDSILLLAEVAQQGSRGLLFHQTIEPGSVRRRSHTDSKEPTMDSCACVYSASRKRTSWRQLAVWKRLDCQGASQKHGVGTVSVAKFQSGRINRMWRREGGHEQI